jgi:hypothetical protein
LSASRLQYIGGPQSTPAGPVLLCRLENGEEWIPSFLEHYRSLGVSRMIFLDTGSTDRSVDLLRDDDVTLYRTEAPFRTHRLEMRRWLADLCAAGTWTLNVDIDELFVAPFGRTGTRPPLSSLTDYLEAHGYTALRAHMLDCFGSGPIGSRDAPADAPLIEQYPWYDLSDVRPLADPYFFGSILPAYVGGIRKTAFGLEHCWLTKHPLIRTGCGIGAFETGEHAIRGECLADITGALLHFKFTPGFRAYVDSAVRRAQHWNDSEEYQFYQRTLTPHRDLVLKQETARRWSGMDALIDAGFLQMSDAFRNWTTLGLLALPGTRLGR